MREAKEKKKEKQKQKKLEAAQKNEEGLIEWLRYNVCRGGKSRKAEEKEE